MDALWERARTTWPGIVVSRERFAAEASRRLGGAVENLAQVHDDLYLAIAASDGDRAAIVECDRIASREVDFAQGRLRATATQADDVRADLRRLFFTTEPGRAGALLSFSGRGSLRGYARVIVARELVRRIQRDRRELPLEDDVLDALVPSVDPEIEHLRERYRDDVDAAFRDAIVALGDRERAVLRYHLLDGWSIDQIGERYGVHRATAARWVSAARETLGDQIRSRLAERLSIPRSQVSSIVQLVTSAIEVSLDRLLA